MWCVLALAAGCNQLLGLDRTKHYVADAPTDAVGCTGVEFGNVTMLSGAAFAGLVTDPSLTDDPLALWFATSPNTGKKQDLMMATRATSDGPFDTVVPLTTVNSPADDFDPQLTADGLDLVFVSNRGGPNQVYEATRASTAESFSSPRLIAELAATQVDRGIDLRYDGLVLYYVDGNYDLHAVPRPRRTAAFGIPSQTLASNLNYPAVSPDELELFATPDTTSIGTVRLTRSDPTQPFSTQTQIDSTYTDPDLSPDSTRMMLDSADGTAVEMRTRTCP